MLKQYQYFSWLWRDYHHYHRRPDITPSFCLSSVPRVLVDGIFYSETRCACHSARASALLGYVQARGVPPGNRNVCLLLLCFLLKTTSFNRASLLVLQFSSLQSYDLDSAVAVIRDGSATMKIDTQHLRDISFRSGSTFQFIGDLLIRPNVDVTLSPSPASVNELYVWYHWNNNAASNMLLMSILQAILQARVGRNVDGLDLNLYQQSLIVRRQHEARLLSSRST